MLNDAIKTFEELKKFIFIIDRGTKENIVIKFENENFYHLIGLHKIRIDNFLPNKIMSKDKIYKYLKANVDKYENILEDLIKEQKRLELRITSFPYILELLENNSTILYNLNNERPNGSLYKGDYGLFNLFEDICCLFGLKENNKIDNIIYCAPQSWMPDNRKNNLIKYKQPIYMKKIIKIPIKLYNVISEKIIN